MVGTKNANVLTEHPSVDVKEHGQLATVMPNTHVAMTAVTDMSSSEELVSASAFMAACVDDDGIVNLLQRHFRRQS